MTASRDLRNLDWIKKQATMSQAADLTRQTAGLPRGTIRGTIVDVADPENRGRVRVVFDDMNPDIPQVSGAGEWSQERTGKEPDKSHWIDTSPAFNGRQPRGMVGKRVSIVASNGQYQYAVLQDVMFDPQILAEGKQDKLKMPNNSSMTRLPIYEPDEIPMPSEDNHGCLLVENNGPMNGDWICVCVKRDGQYYWVRLADLAHGHAGGNDGSQQVDSLGNRQNPVMQGTTGDSVFPTTHQQFTINSDYTTKPQGNPKGEESHWYPAPQSGQKYKEGENKLLINPLPDPSLEFVRSPAGFPGMTSSIQGFAPTSNPSIAMILEPKAQQALQKAQEIGKRVSELSASIPSAAAATKFISSEALKISEGSNPQGVPPGSEVALGALPNAEGTLNVTQPVPSKVSVPSPILTALKKVLGFKI